MAAAALLVGVVPEKERFHEVVRCLLFRHGGYDIESWLRLFYCLYRLQLALQTIHERFVGCCFLLFLRLLGGVVMVAVRVWHSGSSQFSRKLSHNV